MDILQAQVLRDAASIKQFAEGEPTFCFGDWRDWRTKCAAEGRAIPPAEFKAKRAAERATSSRN